MILIIHNETAFYYTSINSDTSFTVSHTEKLWNRKRNLKD